MNDLAHVPQHKGFSCLDLSLPVRYARHAKRRMTARVNNGGSPSWLQSAAQMISTFDLTLLGSMVSAGGLLFLREGKRPHLNVGWLAAGTPADKLTANSLEHHARSTALAGARWLTVGALTLFIAYAHGAEEGYLFGPWTDVMFHLIFVSACWATTAFRINQAAERTATVTLVKTSSHPS
jgi:hypothetical protein